MVVNWDRGKSAALIEIRGALSRTAKRDLYLEHGSEIAMPGTDCVVHLERSYVHLRAPMYARAAPWALRLLPASVPTPRKCPP